MPHPNDVGVFSLVVYPGRWRWTVLVDGYNGGIYQHSPAFYARDEERAIAKAKRWCERRAAEGRPYRLRHARGRAT